ncbi:ras-responsive element-binding protein 1 [Galendromus occidentalis]|uniref:Ras-responsive element-binding protein 1 n=1 Tax=Galendromus occidentalis TaxID=34638 RepID=A0AAJ7SHP0_9ACAR|nr:ras-responsive element-binding protein 1 [Galendromus occidentalis]
MTTEDTTVLLSTTSAGSCEPADLDMSESDSDDDELRLTITDTESVTMEREETSPPAITLLGTPKDSPGSVISSHKCQVCGESAPSAHGLSMHLRRVHDVISCTSSQLNPAQHTCRLCGKGLSSASSLDRHMLVHSGERPFKCKICGMAFTTNGNMHRHMRTHSGAPLIAPLLQMQSQLLQLENTRNRKSPAPPSIVSPFAPQDFRCLICGRLFLSKSALEKHAVNVHDDSAVSCPKCFALCSQYSSLIDGLHTCIEPNSSGSSSSTNFDDLDHLEFSATKYNLIAAVECDRRPRRCPSVRGYDCERCLRSFPSREALAIHRNRHEDSQVFCVVCNTSYGSCGDLQRHQSEVHKELVDDKTRLMSALQLQANCSSPRHDLSDVQTLLSLATSGTAQCPPADAINSENSCDSVSDSLLLGYSGDSSEQDSVCHMCGMAFKNLHRLKRHLQLHVNAPFACTLCSYVSTDKSTLVRHLRTHNGERPFQCAICKYAFTTKANCERHVRKRHNKQTKSEIRSAMQYNPHMQSQRLSPTFSAQHDSGSTVCKYCNKDFKFNRVLRHHLRSLNNSCSRKPFSCVVCKLGFSTKNNCIRHVLKQHPDYRHRLAEAVSSKPLPSDGIQDPPIPLTFNNDTEPLSDSTMKDDFDEDVEEVAETKLFAPTPEPALLKSGTVILGPIKGILGPFHHITVSPIKVDVTSQPTVHLRTVVPGALSLESSRKIAIDSPISLPKETKVTVIPAAHQKVKENHPGKLALPPQDEPLDLAVHALDLSRKEESGHDLRSLPVKNNYIDVILTAAKYVPEATVPSAGASPLPTKVPPVSHPVAASPKAALVPQAENLKKDPSPPITKTFLLSDKTRSALKILVNAKKSEEKPFEEAEPHDLASVSDLLDAANSHLMLEEMLGDNSKDSNNVPGNENPKHSNSTLKKVDTKVRGLSEVRASSRKEAPNSVACEHCRRKFPWSSSLRRHMLTHSGQKPYKCPHCPIRFTTKSNCERHLIRKHEKSSASLSKSSLKWNEPEEKASVRVNCVCCSRSFANETSLKDHQSHQSEKPFRCVLCCRLFAEATECAQHAETEHDLRVQPEKSDPNSCSHLEGQVCFVCYQRLEDAVALRMHFKTSHGLDGNNNTRNSSAGSPLSTSPKSGTKGTLVTDDDDDSTRTDGIHSENRRIAVSAS